MEQRALQSYRCCATVQGHCPAMMTATDLVFLEPALLLVDDPSALGPRTWQVIQRVAESIRQRYELSIRIDSNQSNRLMSGHGKSEHIHVCDVVPVCLLTFALPCLHQPSAGDT